MQSRYGLKVNNSSLNVFITGSLSGGTGSGMLIDLGYCVRHWLKGQSSPLVTGIVPMPNAFAAISVGDRVLANGYAANSVTLPTTAPNTWRNLAVASAMKCAILVHPLTLLTLWAPKMARVNSSSMRSVR